MLQYTSGSYCSFAVVLDRLATMARKHRSYLKKTRAQAAAMVPKPQSEMSTDCGENPDFCSWSKVYIPYCTGDMHSGTQMEPNPALANYYYSGHLQIAGVALGGTLRI